MTRFGMIRLTARTARTAAGPGAFLALLAVATACLVVAAPGPVEGMLTGAIRYDLNANASAAEREVRADGVGALPFGPSGDPSASGLSPEADAVWGALEDQLGGMHASMGPTLRASVGPAQFTTVTDAVTVSTLPGEPPAQVTELALGADPRFADRIRLDSGRLPDAVVDGGDVDVVLSTACATAAEWHVGDRRSLTTPSGTRVVRLSGTFTPVDPTDPFWTHTSSLVRPSVVAGVSGSIVIVQGYVAPESWPEVAAVAAPVRSSVWFRVDPGTVTMANAGALVAELRAFESQAHVVNREADRSRLGVLRFSSRVPVFIDASVRRDVVSLQLLEMLAAGPASALLAALVLAARLFARRLAVASRVMAARGSGRLRLRVLTAVSALAWLLPGAVVGVLAGRALGGTAPAGWTVAITLAVTAFMPGLVAAGRRDTLETGSFRVRVMVELGVLTVAVMAVLVLVRNGAATASSTVSLNPLLVVGPPVVALACAIVALRILPVALRGLATLGRRRRGLTAFLGAARNARTAAGGAATMMALSLGLSIAVFSGSILSTLTTGIETSSRLASGADLRVSDSALSADQLRAMAAVPGVRRLAAVSTDRGIDLSVGASHEVVSVLVVDTAALDVVQAGVPGGLTVPASFTRTDGGAVPVILSRRTADLVGGEPLSLGGHELSVAAVAPSVTSLSNSTTWILVDAAVAPELLAGIPSPEVALARLDGTARPDEVAQAVRRAVGSEPTVTTPAALIEARTASPAFIGLRRATAVAIALSGISGAFAIVMTLVLGAAARSRLFAALSALGATRRDERALTVWEVGPVTVAALVTGGGVGVLLARMIVPVMDLRPFTGLVGTAATVIDVPSTALFSGAFCVVVMLAVALSMTVLRMTRGRRNVRPIEEG
jgi:putative ABC transport system permease protein